MKNRIIKITLLLTLIIVRSVIMAAPVKAETIASNTIVEPIPVRFQYDISTKDINEGEALPLEVVNDVYINGQKLFAQGNAGYAYIDELKHGRMLGRGGQLSISRGQLVDVNGKTHQVILSTSSKGNLRLSSASGALLMGATATDAIINSSSTVGTLLGVGLGVGALGYLLRKGDEATISRGKVMFAHLSN